MLYIIGLPESMKEIMPLYKDGLELWKIMETYIQNYIDIFYTTDNDIHSDIELVNYWNDFETHLPLKNYILGPLMRSNLVKHLTYSIFWVTANHTFVGDIQEYILDDNSVAPFYEGLKNATIQTCMLKAALISLTSAPMPHLVDDWKHIFIHSGSKEKTNKILKRT